MILGHEFSGVVDTPAPDSSRFRGGENVAVFPNIPCDACPGCRELGPFHCKDYQFLGSRNDGGFAEYCLVPETNLLLLPEEVDLRYGALVEPLAVALHTVRRSEFTPGRSALVLGAGPIGILIGMWLKFFGAERVGIADVRPESLELARRLGLDEAVHAKTLEAHAETSPFDFVYEAAGAVAALRTAIEVAAAKGTITVVGRESGDTVIPHQYFERLMRKELKLVGCWGYTIAGEERLIRKVLTYDRFDFGALITQEVPLADAEPVIRRMVDKSFYYCKVMLKS